MAQPLLLAGWDFQTTTWGGTGILTSPQTPAVFQANFGVGILYLNGEYGSSPWSSTQRTAYAGSSINTSGTSFSTLTTGLGSLGLLSGSGLNGNGKSLVFKIPIRNHQSLSVSYSAQRSSTGFSHHRWEFSYDLIQWNVADSVQSGTEPGTITSSFGNTGIIYIHHFGPFGIGDTAYLRLTLDSSSSSSGNNRLDNFQIRAWPTEISSDTLRILTVQPPMQPTQKTLVHCAGGYRSLILVSLLASRGYTNLVNIEGGYSALRSVEGLDHVAGASCSA